MRIFIPFSTGHRRLATAFALAALWACGTTEPSTPPTVLPGIEPVATTYLQFTGDPGDWVSQGVPRSFGLFDGAWSVGTEVTAGVHHLTVALNTNTGGHWRLDLAAPAGQTLALGTYENAQRYPFQTAGAPALSFSGDGRACNQLSGTFVIQELVYGPASRVDKLHVVFEQHCEIGTPALRGEVAIAGPWQ